MMPERVLGQCQFCLRNRVELILITGKPITVNGETVIPYEYMCEKCKADVDAYMEEAREK